MTKTIEISGQFKRDLKRANKQHRKLEKLDAIAQILAKGKKLPTANKPYKLVGNWSPKWECHIEPDWLLIYETFKDKVILYRTGSHAELF